MSEVTVSDAEVSRATEAWVREVVVGLNLCPFARIPLEQGRIQTGLLELGVRILQQRSLAQLRADGVDLACVFTGRIERVDCQALVQVTKRTPQRELYDKLVQRQADGGLPAVSSLSLIGDALAPGTIAAAVYGGHRCARELGQSIDPDRAPFRREIPWFDES